jgi:Right handed beta helix region
MNVVRLRAVLRCALVPAILAAPALPVGAQPSGGPYGPVPQTYAVPAGAPHVYYVAPDGKSPASGTGLAEPTTLESAFERVVTGDVIVLRGGTYRTGGLHLNQGITLQPYGDERPVLKGTRVATEWQALSGNVWRTSWKTLFPARPLGWWRREREGARTPLHRFNNDMVFVDGEPLRSAGWEGELDAKSFYVDYDAGHVYVGTDPRDRLVEITAFDSAIVRVSREAHGKPSDRKGPVIRGITFTQYAYRAIDVEGKKPATLVTEEPTDDPVGPQEPGTFGKEVVGTTLENVTISHTSRVAGYFRGDRLTIRNSLFSDTSTEGVYVIASADVLLERNIFRRNNVEKLTGYYPSAVKIFNQSYRVTCRDNLVIDNPDSNGIWYDVGNVDGVFVNNWVENANDGFFFEISKGAICAGNVFVGCQKGVRVLNSRDVRVYHNTFVDSVASFERNERSNVGDHFGWHPRTGPGVDEREGHVFVGNLLVAGESFRKPLLRFEQPQALCEQLTRSQAKQVDGNVYVRYGSAGGPLLVWSPATGERCQVEVGSLEELRNLQSGFETAGRVFSDYVGALFKSPELRNLELARALPGLAAAASDLPAEVLRVLGWPAGKPRTPGAYPASR